MIVNQAKIEGCGKGTSGWFDLREVNVSYDHPFHIRLEHALNIDFVNEAQGPGARVAVELTPEAARELAKTILATLEQAETDGWLEETAEHAHGSMQHTHAHGATAQAH
jgi:hypothetical protein